MPFSLAPLAGRPVRLLACTAAALALAACGNSSNHDGSQVVAKVNDAEISVHQINYVLQRQPGLQPSQVDAASKEILDKLIDQEFAVQKAVKLKVDRDPAVMQALAAARRDVLARAYASRVADSAAKPESADIRSYYDAHPQLFAQRRIYALQELLVQADDAQIAALRDKVKTAKTMAEVSEYLKSKSLPVRANQTTQPAENFAPALLTHLSTLHDGQAMMAPMPGGARLIFVAATRQVPITLEQATPAITQAITAERRRQAVEQDMKTLRESGQVKYVGKFAVAMEKGDKAGKNAAAASASTELPPLPSTAPASGAQAPDVDAATMRKGISGLN